MVVDSVDVDIELENLKLKLELELEAPEVLLYAVTPPGHSATTNILTWRYSVFKHSIGALRRFPKRRVAFLCTSGQNWWKSSQQVL